MPKRDLSEYIITVYGAPKIGKSTFCSQFEKPLFLATEKGLNALSTYNVPVTKWEDFLEAGGAILKGNHDFKTIVIDTIDNLIRFCSEYVCRKNGIQYEGDMPHGKGWYLVKNEFRKAITLLSLAPYGLILVSHEETKEIKTRTSVYNKAVPTISQSYREFVLGLSDMILYAHPIQRTNPETQKVEELRVLRTKASENWEAGDRTGFLPATLEFSYEAFDKAWNDFSKNNNTKEQEA